MPVSDRQWQIDVRDRDDFFALLKKSSQSMIGHRTIAIQVSSVPLVILNIPDRHPLTELSRFAHDY